MTNISTKESQQSATSSKKPQETQPSSSTPPQPSNANHTNKLEDHIRATSTRLANLDNCFSRFSVELATLIEEKRTLQRIVETDQQKLAKYEKELTALRTNELQQKHKLKKANQTIHCLRSFIDNPDDDEL